jgi:Fe-S-cluster containining protein
MSGPDTKAAAREQAVAASAQANLGGMLRQARQKRLFEALERVYAAFPETTCENCARCCFESPGVFFVEYLHLMKAMWELPQAQWELALQRALGELLFSWVDRQRQCIFLESSRCMWYQRRPLACRLFGLVSPADREQAEVEARMAAREEARRLSLLGIRVPEEVVTRSLVSCDRVRDRRGRAVRVEAEAIAARVARLDEVLLPREVVVQEFCFLSLPERLGAALLGRETVDTMRIQLLRRVQRGERMASLVEEVWELVRGESRKVMGEKGRES